VTPARVEAEPQTLVQFLEDGARRFSGLPALLYKPGLRYERWSYERLLEDARRCAGMLHARGLQKGDRVLICSPNCPQWVIVYFGCAFAGVVGVPLDIRSAPDFVQRVEQKTEPRLAFFSRRNPNAYPVGVPVVFLEDLETLLVKHEQLQGPVEPSDVLEIMFTSGTTGEPKGVMLTHANLMTNLQGARERVPADPSYRLLSILPLSHMLEQMGGLLLPLLAGGNVTYAISLQPSALMRVMQERRVTLMLVVPQVLSLFLNGIEREVERRRRTRLWDRLVALALKLPFGWRRLLFRSVHKRFGGGLRIFFTGGAALDPNVGRKWEALGVRVIQGYGATEASPVIAAHSFADPRYDSAGRPLSNLELKIEADGEIVIRGPNVSQGYWRAPEQTAAAFADGWYRTGDLGELDADGFLHIRGRKKDMIALASGQKVFPEDVEAVLLKHPAVIEAAVVGLPRDNGPEVHAALLMREDKVAAEAVAWANEQLADHQKVRGFTVWPEPDFPRTHTLKVRKNLVLDFLLGRAPAQAEAPKPPGKPAAERLISLLAEISELPVEQVTPESTLGADLNLDSLKRVELLSQLEEELGVSLDDGAVDGETTVSELTTMTRSEPAQPETRSFPRWSRSWWCRPLRAALQSLLLLPLLRRLYVVEIRGADVLTGLHGPVILVANHNLYLDNAVFIHSLPASWRRRLAIAAAAEIWRNPVFAVINPLFGNAFPFSREGSIRASMENLVRILDEGWNVLIYPEGRLTIGGPIQEFKTGIGLLAVGANVPVLPMALTVQDAGQPRHVPWRKRGRVTVSFGRTLRFESTQSYIEVTRTIEDAVRVLAAERQRTPVAAR
jgi:long-chain acyl-CoA synthetase